MTELILLLVVGLALLTFFLRTILSYSNLESEKELNFVRLPEVITLCGLEYEHSHLFFDDGDYQFLRSQGRLEDAAAQLRRDRRQMALLWLRLLQSDLNTLWKLRRFLTRQGVTAGIGEEFRVAVTCASALLLIVLIRVTVYITGPFAVSRGLRNAKLQLLQVGRSCEKLLALIPPSRWLELKQQWTPGAASPA